MEELKSNLQSLKLAGMASCVQALYETRKLHELS